MSDVLDALIRGGPQPGLVRQALLWRGPQQEALFAAARQRRTAFFPAEQVEVRSVIEVSNICSQRCRYCAIGGNEERETYTITDEQLTALVGHLYTDKARRVVLLQSGENDKQDFVDHMCHCVRTVKQQHPDLVMILCLGNMSRALYQQLREAGAERYILKFETSNPKLYESLKPRDTFARRIRCLEDLVDLGFQVGSGNMVGLPGQSLEDMVNDIIFLGKYPLAMSSCTPFIPGETSKLAHEPMGDVDLALNTMALARVLYPDRLIPTTSSLEKARPNGQYLGLMAGANTVTIHDGTPPELKKLFPIYSSKRFAPGDDHLLRAVTAAHMSLAQGALK